MYKPKDFEACFNYFIHLAAKLDTNEHTSHPYLEDYQSFRGSLGTPNLENHTFMLNTHKMMASICHNWYIHPGIYSILSFQLEEIQTELLLAQDENTIETLENLSNELSKIPVASKLLSSLIEQCQEAILSQQSFNSPDFMSMHKSLLSFLDDDSESVIHASKTDQRDTEQVNEESNEVAQDNLKKTTERLEDTDAVDDVVSVTSIPSSLGNKTSHPRQGKLKKEKKKETQKVNAKQSTRIPQSIQNVPATLVSAPRIIQAPQISKEDLRRSEQAQQMHKQLIEENRRLLQERYRSTSKNVKRPTRESKWIRKLQNNRFFQGLLIILNPLFATILFTFNTIAKMINIADKSIDYLVIKPYQYLVHPTLATVVNFSDRYLSRLAESNVLRLVLTVTGAYRLAVRVAPEPKSEFLKTMQLEQLSNFFLSAWITGPLTLLYLRKFYIEGKILTKYKNNEMMKPSEVVRLLQIKSKEGKILIFNKETEIAATLEKYFEQNNMSHLSKVHIKPK